MTGQRSNQLSYNSFWKEADTRTNFPELQQNFEPVIKSSLRLSGDFLRVRAQLDYPKIRRPWPDGTLGTNRSAVRSDGRMSIGLRLRRAPQVYPPENASIAECFYAKQTQGRTAGPDLRAGCSEEADV